MRIGKIAPSVMCVDFMKLEETLKIFEENQIEYIHVDIMDGEFVPNYTLGTDFCKMLKRNTRIPLDIHLMIKNPEYKLNWFSFDENDYVSVHYESTPHIHRALSTIKQMGGKPMLALNPGTPLSVMEHLLDDMDALLLMTVNPGFAGQKLISQMLDKIRAARAFLDARGYQHIELEVDGNVSFENAAKMYEAGADIFVAGSSSLFDKNMDLNTATIKLRSCIGMSESL